MAADTPESTDPKGQGGEELLSEPSRRKFFKRVAIGGGATLLGGAATIGWTKAQLQGRPDPEALKTDETFKPKDQRDVVLCFARSKALNEQHPERNEKYAKLQGDKTNINAKDFHFYNYSNTFEHNVPFDNSKPGYTQKDKALHHAAWHPLDSSESHSMAFTQPNTRMLSWDQSGVEKEQYQFKSKEDAATSIKSAARVWGAVRCGITKRDRRWDYDPLYDIANERTLSWEKDFPFEPKTVIVMLVPMDYDNISTAPFWTAEASIGHGYVVMAQIANQVAKFLQGMGYHAVGCGNDLSASVPYAIAAGLGEGGRNAQLLAPGIGPRHRICKVYTDLEFVEYDQPHNWGITEFCLACGKCAEACPAEALPLPAHKGGAKDGGYGFQPSYEFADEPGYTWSNHTGVQKFYTDAKKCFNFWLDNDSACGNCISACTFNEADVWHHWFIMGITGASPAFLHKWMAELHPVFGYGAHNDPAMVEKFWQTGEGMRVNPGMKNNIGTSNKA